MFVGRSLALHWLIRGLCILFSREDVAARPSSDVVVGEAGRSSHHVGAESLATRDAFRHRASQEFEISITDPTASPPAKNNNDDDDDDYHLQKRGSSRPLDYCPAGETYVESHCREAVSPQSYVLQCTDGLDNSWYFRRCAPSEICIQGIPKRRPPLPNGQLVPPSQKAYCVATVNFQRLAQDAATHKTMPAAVGVKYSVPAGKQLAVEAVLTGQNMSESIFAESLQMSAQTSDEAYAVRTWRSQVGGTAVCTDCARVLIAPVPPETERIVLSVVLKAGAAGGLLFLPSVAL